MARAFLLNILGAYLFANGGKKVSLRWLSLFRDFGQAWEVKKSQACLVYLYLSLDILNRGTLCQLVGPWKLIELDMNWWRLVPGPARQNELLSVELSWTEEPRDVLDEYDFMHLGFVGNQFTWSRHFEDGRSIWKRLDRGLATNAWFQKFLGSHVHHLHYDSSDHSPLFIILSSLEPPPQKKNFRFEEMWLSDGRCGEIVEAL
ncbi:hypothetical protein SO802_013671 [Lithocarpus litseifolius]|uniref:Uncharacterized protein n=1 Tax=Lithocarpus litseifolius TaxID=425828 RepID=A0AAW2D9X9_9ROSI